MQSEKQLKSKTWWLSLAMAGGMDPTILFARTLKYLWGEGRGGAAGLGRPQWGFLQNYSKQHNGVQAALDPGTHWYATRVPSAELRVPVMLFWVIEKYLPVSAKQGTVS